MITDYLDNRYNLLEEKKIKSIFRDNLLAAFQEGIEDKISKVYEKKDTKHPFEIDTVVDNLYYVTQLKENYSILILNLLSLNSKKKTHLNLCIDDAFSDLNRFQIEEEKMKNPKFKVTNNVFKHVFVNKIFTKQNKKPTLKIRNYVRDMFLVILNKYNEQLNDYKDSITFVSQNYFNKKVKESHNDLHSLIKRIVDQSYYFTAKLPEIEFNKDILIKRFNFEFR